MSKGKYVGWNNKFKTRLWVWDCSVSTVEDMKIPMHDQWNMSCKWHQKFSVKGNNSREACFRAILPYRIGGSKVLKEEANTCWETDARMQWILGSYGL